MIMMLIMMASPWVETSTWWRAGKERSMSQRFRTRADADDLWQTVQPGPSVKSRLNGSRYISA